MAAWVQRAPCCCPHGRSKRVAVRVHANNRTRQQPGQLLPTEPRRRFRTLPQISYSVNKRDVSGAELAQLLAAARAPYMAATGHRPTRVHWDYWRTKPGFRHAQKLELAINSSIMVVAAFTNVDLYPRAGLPSETEDSRSRASSHGAASSRGGAFASSPPPERRRCLAGFCRATGDNALVATVYDLAVHPDLQGFGIGHKMLRLLVQQVYSRGTYDIGMVVPTEMAAFFAAGSFEDDREGSSCMTFTGHLGELEAITAAYRAGAGAGTSAAISAAGSGGSGSGSGAGSESDSDVVVSGAGLWGAGAGAGGLQGPGDWVVAVPPPLPRRGIRELRLPGFNVTKSLATSDPLQRVLQQRMAAAYPPAPDYQI